jgi:hypothetical protein
VTSSPPSYDDAIKLNPNALLKLSQSAPQQQNHSSISGGATNNAFSINSEIQSTSPRPSASSSSFPNNIINKLKPSSNITISMESEKSELSPPPYSISSTTATTIS